MRLTSAPQLDKRPAGRKTILANRPKSAAISSDCRTLDLLGYG